MPELSPPQVNRKLEIHLWWFTALMIAVNVGLFAWQVLHGMDISSPSTADAIRWGADYAPLSFLAEPVRLLTSMFFHFGLIHLMLNMWALYMFGSLAEQIFGRFYVLGMYLCCGLAGSLLSGWLSIHDSFLYLQTGQTNLLPSINAGASGAIMGLGSALTILSFFPTLPHQSFILT